MTNKKTNIKNSILDGNNFIYDKSTINSLRANGRSKNPGDVNVLEIFLQKYETQPKLFRVGSENESYYNWDKLKDLLSDFYPELKIIFSDNYYDLNKDIYYTKQETWKLRDGVILQMEGSITEDLYLSTYDIDNINNICSFNLFLYKDTFDEYKEISQIFKACLIDNKKNVSIGMVSTDDGGFYVKEFDIDEKASKLELLDEHYGVGFKNFNDQLLERLKTNTKGLTLFHGEPGTGKTTIIRHLLREIKLSDNNNNILYFPPTMVDSITDPNFINFITDWVSDSTGKNYLLIEDAEPLLESRNQSRNIGITNLLNLTDGLLNDILNIQIIATFNTKLNNIDSALLRPERLIARKNFKKLSIEDAKNLAKIINVDSNLINTELSLAEIYSMKNDTKPIIHDIEEIKNIGF